MSKKDFEIKTSQDGASRRIVLSAAGGLLLGVGSLAVLLGHGGPVTSSKPLLAQAPTVPGAPTNPGQTRPGRPGRTTKPVTGPPNSFSGAPAAYEKLQGGGTGQTGAGPGGFPSGPGGGSTAAAGTGGASASKPAPIVPGASAPSYRKDPFVSYRIQPYQKPPAYTFIAPMRLAAYPEPPKPKPNPNPELEFGPLPYVPRRVAGVLLRGQVSAILETGGIGGDTQLVRPGSVVPSGIAGVPSLTVSSITPTQLTLRAPDGRTVSVDLSASATGTPQTGGGTFGGGAPAGGGGFGGGGFRGGKGAPAAAGD